MREITGTYNTAKVFTDVLDNACVQQIQGLLNLEVFKDTRVRIMPDCHAGASCVIGFTADLGDKVIPNIVGVDIGCGMLTVQLGKIDIDYPELDRIIHERIPYGRNVNESRLMRFPQLQEMYCYRELKDTKSIERSIGSLGGGNHFIEIDVDEDDNKYLVIHTGSRQLGKQTAEYYQKVATGLHTGWGELWKQEEEIKKEYKEAGRRDEIKDVIKELHRNFHQTAPDMPLEYCYLSGVYTEKYLHDMRICQTFADENRKMIAGQIHPNMHMLLGNHELMALEALDASLWSKPRYMSLWAIHNGGQVTYSNLLKLPKAEYKEVVEYMHNLPTSMEVEEGGRQFYLVHGFPADNVYDEVWTRPYLDTPNPLAGKTLIVGHTPVFYYHGKDDREVDDYIYSLRVKKEHFKIEHAEGFIGIDCACCACMPESRLACLRLDDMEEFYV